MWSVVLSNAHMAMADYIFNNPITKTFFPEIKTNVGSPKEVLVDDPDEMFQLADLLEGVSVDCAEFSSETRSPGIE